MRNLAKWKSFENGLRLLDRILIISGISNSCVCLTFSNTSMTKSTNYSDPNEYFRQTITRRIFTYQDRIFSACLLWEFIWHTNPCAHWTIFCVCIVNCRIDFNVGVFFDCLLCQFMLCELDKILGKDKYVYPWIKLLNYLCKASNVYPFDLRKLQCRFINGSWLVFFDNTLKGAFVHV